MLPLINIYNDFQVCKLVFISAKFMLGNPQSVKNVNNAVTFL